MNKPAWLFLCVLCVSSVAGGGFSSAARAQAPEIGGLLPSGGPRGQSTLVRIDGKALAGAHLHLSGGGIVVKSLQVAPGGDLVTADLAVEPGASLGPHEVRITTPKGVSGGVQFWVDLYPNRVLERTMQESEPPVPLDGASPGVINGRIAMAAGRARFTLTAAAGDTWVFDCFADRIRSRFDPVLELKDEAGVSLRLVQSTWESDPRFCYRFAKAGRYFLTVRDSEYKGGPNFTYRLLAGRMPFVAGYAPRGERPGHAVALTLEGTGLPATHATVSIPADAAPGTCWAELPMGSGPPQIVPLLVDPAPVFAAEDGNRLQPLPALPANLDGVFLHVPRARFSFHADAKTKILFDLLGRRIGSRIDGELRVRDAAGKEIAANDDMGPLSKDARLEFTAPEDGDYTLEVHNVEDVVGPDCGWRLQASVVAPDFQISIATDRLTTSAGGTVALPVEVQRTGNFDGPVEVRVEGLPAGVTAHGGVIPAGKPSVEITLTAAPDAALSAAAVHILGVAMIGGKTVTREAPAWERYDHRSIDLGLAVEFNYAHPHHLWDMLLLAVTERADPITVTTPVTVLTLTPGSTVEIPIHVVREANAKSAVTLDARNLPAKVTAKAAPIPPGQTDGKLLLSAAPDVAPVLVNIIVQAHHDKSVALTPAIRLTVEKK